MSKSGRPWSREPRVLRVGVLTIFREEAPLSDYILEISKYVPKWLYGFEKLGELLST